MSCETKKYITDLPITESEKTRLDSIHNQIGEDAIKTKAFRRNGENITSLKDSFNEATKFIKDTNDKFSQKVVKLVKTINNNFNLEADVSKLAETPGAITYDNLLTIEPDTTISREEFDSLQEEEQETLIYQLKNC